MTNKELVHHNISLTFDFLREVVRHPEILDSVKEGAEIEFVQKNIVTRSKSGLKKSTRYFKVLHKFEVIGN